MIPLGLRALEQEGKVASDDASIPEAMCGDERRFETGVPGIRLEDGMEKTYRWIYDQMTGTAVARKAYVSSA